MLWRLALSNRNGGPRVAGVVLVAAWSRPLPDDQIWQPRGSIREVLRCLGISGSGGTTEVVSAVARGRSPSLRSDPATLRLDPARCGRAWLTHALA